MDRPEIHIEIDDLDWLNWAGRKKLWVAYPPGNIGHVGGARTIVIFQKTGEILADAMLGE